MNAPIRVLNIIGSLAMGGAQRRVLDLHRSLDPDLVQFDYLVADGPSGDLEAEAVELGGRIYRYSWGPAFPRWYLQLLDEVQPDVVHGHMHYTSAPMLLLADRAGVPVRVVHFRSSHDGKADTVRRRLQRNLARRWIDGHATDILAVSRDALELAWTQHQGADARCRVIHNGLDFGALTSPSRARSEVRSELSIDPDAPVIIHIGRFHAVKNHGRLVEMFSKVHALRPDVVLVMVGDGAETDMGVVRDRVRSLGMTDVVRMTGMRTDVVDLLHASDLLVLPSLWEGLPGVVIEARAAGLPVVANDLGGIREISDELGGVAVLPLSAEDDRWAAKMVELAADRSAVEPKLDLAALEASAFSTSRCLDQLMEVWKGRSRVA